MNPWLYYGLCFLSLFPAIFITAAFDGGLWFLFGTAITIVILIRMLDEFLGDRRKAREQAAEAAAKAERAEEMKAAVREVLAEGGDPGAEQKPSSHS